MTRRAAVLWLVAATALTAGLFYVKHQVQGLEERLEQANRSIEAQRQAIQVLKAEWSYLNQLSRIAELAQRHLDLKPFTAQQVVRLEDLPAPAGPPERDHGQPPPAPGKPSALVKMEIRP